MMMSALSGSRSGSSRSTTLPSMVARPEEDSARAVVGCWEHRMEKEDAATIQEETR